MSTNDSQKFLEYWAGMHFEARQIAWDGTYKRSFRQLHSRSKRTPIWECWVVGDRYYTRQLNKYPEDTLLSRLLMSQKP